MLLLLLACSGDTIGTDPDLLQEDTAEVVVVDLDGDGAGDDVDCDDENAAVYPEAIEICDGLDNNCDGVVDEGVTSVVYPDLDGDGYGDTDGAEEGCPGPDTTDRAGDCDDSNSSIHPAAQEVCDPNDADEDCDGLADDLDDDTDPKTMSVGYLDADGDGFGANGGESRACSLSVDYIDRDGDCDDSDATINPNGTEVCDPDFADEDCDGFANDDDPDLVEADRWYPDTDGDGFGDIQGEVESCAQPSDYIADGTDCDDSDPELNPDDGCAWSGTYVGDFTIDASWAGLLTDTCTGTAEVVVDDTATVQLLGEGDCAWGGTMDKIFGDIVADIDGDFVDVSDAEVDMRLSTGIIEVMNLSFVAPDSLQGTLSGKGKLLVYDITLDLER